MIKSGLINNRALRIKLAWAALLLGGGVFWLSGHSAAPADSAAAAPVTSTALTVRTVGLQEDNWSQTLPANGTILPWQETVISAQLQGVRIAEVKVSIGDRVRRGEVLATLDNAIHRTGDGMPQGKLLAPDDGVISATAATVGSMPQPGAELFRLIRKGRLEWRAELTADELMRMRRGMTARITLSGGRILHGTVRAISPSVDARTRYGYVLVALDASDGVIGGAFARGEFELRGASKVQWLPTTSVMQRGETSYVLVVDADRRVHERAVQTGQRQDTRVEILRGLQPAEVVVESGGPFLTEGDLVQVVKE